MAAALLAAGVLLGAPTAHASGHGVSMQNNRFTPGTLTAAVGDTVTWTHQEADVRPHSVTAQDGSFDSHPMCPPVCMQQGDNYTVTFQQPGRFDYVCKIHAGMVGRIDVVASVAQQSPPAETPSSPAPAGGAYGPSATAPTPLSSSQQAGTTLAVTGPGNQLTTAAVALALLVVGAGATRLGRASRQSIRR